MSKSRSLCAPCLSPSPKGTPCPLLIPPFRWGSNLSPAARLRHPPYVLLQLQSHTEPCSPTAPHRLFTAIAYMHVSCTSPSHVPCVIRRSQVQQHLVPPVRPAQLLERLPPLGQRKRPYGWRLQLSRAVRRRHAVQYGSAARRALLGRPPAPLRTTLQLQRRAVVHVGFPFIHIPVSLRRV